MPSRKHSPIFHLILSSSICSFICNFPLPNLLAHLIFKKSADFMELKDQNNEVGMTSFGHNSLNKQQSQIQNHLHRHQIPTAGEIIPPPSVQPSTSTTAAPSVHYRECLKNHAANIGGHVTDGCGEFMPGGEEGTPESLKCAACECHRSFHRKENNAEFQNFRRDPVPIQPPRPHHHPHHHRFSHTSQATPMMMAFGGGRGAPADSSSEDLNNMIQSNVETQKWVHGQRSKKRYRTKFSQEQKDKMMEFAEKLDWKIQKQDEQELQEFCGEIGVKRHVFKVWMHNNKQAMKKKTQL